MSQVNIKKGVCPLWVQLTVLFTLIRALDIFSVPLFLLRNTGSRTASLEPGPWNKELAPLLWLSSLATTQLSCFPLQTGPNYWVSSFLKSYTQHRCGRNNLHFHKNVDAQSSQCFAIARWNYGYCEVAVGSCYVPARSKIHLQVPFRNQSLFTVLRFLPKAINCKVNLSKSSEKRSEERNPFKIYSANSKKHFNKQTFSIT